MAAQETLRQHKGQYMSISVEMHLGLPRNRIADETRA